MALRVVIHSLDHARAAVTAARAGGFAVVLESPRGAAGRQGIGWWRALLDAMASEFPGRTVDSVLDCGDATGRVLEAMRAGLPAVRVEAPAAVLAALAALAARTGTRVLGPDATEPLDLLAAADPRAAVTGAGTPPPRR
ncbi:MAG: hypothetical protein HY985_07055 [Magnetospirillum sp.]|nr:hypothetical protein [Magnetospirillum sp.]